MFKVDKSWLVPVPRIISDDNCAFYRYVELNFEIFIFILSFSDEIDVECEVSRRIMFINIQDVLKAAGEISDCSISLFSPGHTNIDGEMSISTILEVIQCEEENQNAYIYKCINGKTYIDSNLGHTESQLENKKIIYSKRN